MIPILQFSGWEASTVIICLSTSLNTAVCCLHLLPAGECWACHSIDKLKREFLCTKFYILSIKKEVGKWFGETTQKRLRPGNFHIYIYLCAWNGLYITSRIVVEDHQNGSGACYKLIIHMNWSKCQWFCFLLSWQALARTKRFLWVLTFLHYLTFLTFI